MTAQPQLTGGRSPARQGVTDSVAVIVAYIPFGLALGAAMTVAGVSPWLAWASSPLMFGGAGQLLAVQLLGASATVAVIIMGPLVVNARFLLYGAALAPHAAAWPRRWRWIGAYLLADPVFALAAGRFGGPGRGGGPRDRLVYYLAVGATLWTGWQLLTGAGLLLGGLIPPGLHLERAVPLTFLLLLLPMLTSRAAYAAALVGAAVALAASGLPLGLGLLAGAAAGTGVGALVGGRRV